MGKINIFVEGWVHHKNGRGMELMNSDVIEFHKQLDPNTKYDWVLNLSDFKDYNNMGDVGLIFGPQIMFPAIDINKIPVHKKYICNVLSEWVVNLCEDINPGINFTSLPFAVDVDRFKPLEKIGKPVIYFKQRDKQILSDVLSNLGNDFDIFDYEVRYDETDFLNSISKAPYAIWIGRHESQGFAFQETLSCDTPIFVIDVKSLREEICKGSFWTNYLPGHDLTSTSASYFDDSCGLICYPDNWRDNWGNFTNNIKNYKPREFVIEHLSPESCRKNWINKLK